MDVLAAIRGRAQATRRRVERVDTLSRDQIAADLHQIEVQADRLAALVQDMAVTPPPRAGAPHGAATDGGPPRTPGGFPSLHRRVAPHAAAVRRKS
jgi:hypothetical protein